MLATGLPPIWRATSSEISADGWREPAIITAIVSRNLNFAEATAAVGMLPAETSTANRASCSVTPID